MAARLGRPRWGGGGGNSGGGKNRGDDGSSAMAVAAERAYLGGWAEAQ